MLRYQLKNTIVTPAMVVAIFGQCLFMLVGLPKGQSQILCKVHFGCE